MTTPTDPTIHTVWGFIKAKDECAKILEVEDGAITGAHGLFYSGGVPGHLW